MIGVEFFPLPSSLKDLRGVILVLNRDVDSSPKISELSDLSRF